MCVSKTALTPFSIIVNTIDLYLTNTTDPPVLPTVNFEESVYVVDEGSTVTVNVVRGDDGGVVPINVGG